MRWKTYLPRITNGISVTGEGKPAEMNEAAWAFADAYLKLLGDRANDMVLDSRLVAAAQKHAEYLDSRTGDQLLMSMHRGRNGSYANQRVRAEGYRLPDYYPEENNNVESCARNSSKPAIVAAELTAHPGHHEHLMGVGWFKDHIVYGVGSHGHDYVVIAAPRE